MAKASQADTLQQTFEPFDRKEADEALFESNDGYLKGLLHKASASIAVRTENAVHLAQESSATMSTEPHHQLIPSL